MGGVIVKHQKSVSLQWSGRARLRIILPSSGPVGTLSDLVAIKMAGAESACSHEPLREVL